MPDIFRSQQIENIATETIPAPTPVQKTQEKHVHMFASFCQAPDHATFYNQEPGESNLLFLRRHPITNLGWIITSILLCIPPIFLFLFHNYIPFPLSLLPDRFLVFLCMFYYLLIFMYAFVNFSSWYFTVSFITTKRIVDIDFSDVIYHNVAVTKLNLIEDVDYTQGGVLRSLLRFGDVFVQTAGEKLHFDLLAVPNPSEVTTIIENLIGDKHV